MARARRSSGMTGRRVQEGQASVIRPGMVLSCNVAKDSSPRLVKTIAKVPRWKDWWDVEYLSDQTRCQLELPASAMGTLWKVAEQDIGGEVQSGVGGGGGGSGSGGGGGGSEAHGIMGGHVQEGQTSVIRPGMVLSCNVAKDSSPRLVKTIAKVPRWKEWWNVEFLSDQTRCQLELPASAMGTLWKVAEQDIGRKGQSGVGGGGDGGGGGGGSGGGGGGGGGAQTLTLSTSRADLEELLACSKLDLLARCEANGLETDGNKSILLMRLIDFYSMPQSPQEDGGNNGSSSNNHRRSCRGEGGIGVGRHQLEHDKVPESQGGKHKGTRTGGDPTAIVVPSTSMLSLGNDCLVRVLQLAVGSPLPDWREMFPKLSQFAMVCTKFRDASRQLCSPILSMGSIRDWPAPKQIPLIQMMCARRQKLTELSLTLVDEVELPLLLLLLLKCDVSSLDCMKIFSNKGQPDLFYDRTFGEREREVYDIESAEGLDRLSTDFRIRTSDECFKNMAESMGVTLPRSDLFRPGSTYGLTLAAQCCPALTRLDLGANFKLDASCFDALSGCPHLSYLSIRAIPGDLTLTSIEKWRGHCLASLIVHNQGHYGSVLASLLPVLSSLTSFKIGCTDPDRSQLRGMTVRSESLKHLTIVCKAIDVDTAKFDCPQLRVFHYDFAGGMQFDRGAGGCQIVTMLDNFPLLEECVKGSSASSMELDWTSDVYETNRFRIPPGRPVKASNLMEMRRFFRTACPCQFCTAARW